MHERAVVGEEQHAGRVLVEPTDGLDAARAQRRGQQRIDAWVMARLERALVARRLVEHDQRAFAIGPPITAANAKPELAPGAEVAAGIVDDAEALDLEQPVRHQRGAFAASAEALREEQLGRFHRPDSRQYVSSR